MDNNKNGKYYVIGRGLIGSIFKDDPGYELFSHTEWERVFLDVGSKLVSSGVKGFVCTAALAGNDVCDARPMDEVMAANVGLPVEMLHMARLTNTPLIAFSTSSVYKTGVYNATEGDDLHPHNRYVASKIAMEYALSTTLAKHPVQYDKLYVFRIPLAILNNNHPRDFPEKIKKWERCENVYTSVVFYQDLLDAVNNVFREDIPGGIYNVASKLIHLPSYIKEHFGWEGEVVPAYSMTKTPPITVSTLKARQAGVVGMDCQ